MAAGDELADLSAFTLFACPDSDGAEKCKQTACPYCNDPDYLVRIGLLPKLVRDRTPDRAATLKELTGRTAIFRTASDEEYTALLENKLREETAELIDAASAGDRDGVLEEAADILEVLIARVVAEGFDVGALLRARHEKRERRGMFKSRLVWEGVER